jgi:DNA-binding response OmpR family regulator
MRVLVVEDQPKIAAFVKSGLEENGFVVDLFGGGEEGYVAATTESYDAMVLDIIESRETTFT